MPVFVSKCVLESSTLELHKNTNTGDYSKMNFKENCTKGSVSVSLLPYFMSTQSKTLQNNGLIWFCGIIRTSVSPQEEQKMQT